MKVDIAKLALTLISNPANPNMNTKKSDDIFSIFALAIVLAGIIALAIKLNQTFPI
jgi:hypothetical protein